MQKNYKALALIILLMVAGVPQVNAVSEDVAVPTALGVGITVGTVAGYGCYRYAVRQREKSNKNSLEDDFFKDMHENSDKALAAGVGLFCGFLSAAITHAMLSEMPHHQQQTHYATPSQPSWEKQIEGRLAGIEKNSLIARAFIDKDDFINHVKANAGVSSWPLILACNMLQDFATDLRRADKKLDAVDQEHDLDSVKKQIQEYKDRVFALQLVVEERVALIMSQPEYESQLDRYDKHFERERQREFERKEREAIFTR